MDTIDIRPGYVPGAIGRVTELHGRYYSRHWGLTRAFEAEVARELGEFVERMDPARDGLWLALRGEDVLGSIIIDGGEPAAQGRDHEARLRWFILDEPCQGRGLGRRMMGEAVDFCRRAGFARVYLWTMSGLEAARHLYDAWAFQVTERYEDTDWGDHVLHERLDLVLDESRARPPSTGWPGHAH